MIVITIANETFKDLLRHLSTANEHYEEYNMDADREALLSLIGRIVTNTEWR